MIKQLNHDDSVSDHCIATVHAEQNAIAQAAKNGISTNEATCYITMEPCYSCARLLIQSGIKRIVCLKQYHNAKLSRQICKNANVELIILNNENKIYE